MKLYFIFYFLLFITPIFSAVPDSASIEPFALRYVKQATTDAFPSLTVDDNVPNSGTDLIRNVGSQDVTPLGFYPPTGSSGAGTMLRETLLRFDVSDLLQTNKFVSVSAVYLTVTQLADTDQRCGNGDTCLRPAQVHILRGLDGEWNDTSPEIDGSGPQTTKTRGPFEGVVIDAFLRANNFTSSDLFLGNLIPPGPTQSANVSLDTSRLDVMSTSIFSLWFTISEVSSPDITRSFDCFGRDDPDTSPKVTIEGEVALCGDGVTDFPFEECDNSTANGETNCPYDTPCAVCNSGCEIEVGIVPTCGDGNLDNSFEECDNGTANGETLCPYGVTSCTVCDNNCETQPGLTSFCGDESVDFDNNEQCDNGTANGEDCEYNDACIICTSDCQVETGTFRFCGDGNLDNSFEECDNGTANGETNCLYGVTSCNVCTSSCEVANGTTSFCGDGQVDTANGEECDGGAGCSDNCKLQAPTDDDDDDEGGFLGSTLSYAVFGLIGLILLVSIAAIICVCVRRKRDKRDQHELELAAEN